MRDPPCLQYGMAMMWLLTQLHWDLRIKRIFFTENLPFSVGGPVSKDPIESAFGLGALADLTVANEADPLSFEVCVANSPIVLDIVILRL